MALLRSKVLWNFASILTGNFLNKIVAVFVLAYLTRYLSPAEFGRYSFILAYTAFFGVFTELGVNTFITREISAGVRQPEGLFGDAISVRLVYAAVSVALSLIILSSLGYPGEVVMLGAAACLMLFFSYRGLFFRTVFDIPFQAGLKMGYPAFVNFLSDLLTFASIITLIYFRASLFWLILALGIASVPGFAAMFYLSTKQIRPAFSFDPGRWASIIKGALPLGLSSVLEALTLLIPVFLLSRLSTEASVGLYSLPLRLVASLWVISVAFMSSMLPKMSRDAAASLPSVKDGFTKGLKAMLIIGLPIALLTDEYSDRIIVLFSGPGYAASAPALSMMIWGTLIYFVNMVFYYTFVASGKQHLNAFSWGAVSMVALALCLALIPGSGHMGAAVAFTASFGAGLAMNIALAYRALGIKITPLALRFALSALAAVLVFALMPGEAMISAPMGAGVYLFALVMTKAVSIREWTGVVSRSGREE